VRISYRLVDMSRIILAFAMNPFRPTARVVQLCHLSVKLLDMLYQYHIIVGRFRFMSIAIKEHYNAC